MRGCTISEETQGRERLLHLEAFASKLSVALVDGCKRSGEIAAVKRLHDR